MSPEAYLRIRSQNLLFSQFFVGVSEKVFTENVQQIGPGFPPRFFGSSFEYSSRISIRNPYWDLYRQFLRDCTRFWSRDFIRISFRDFFSDSCNSCATFCSKMLLLTMCYWRFLQLFLFRFLQVLFKYLKIHSNSKLFKNFQKIIKNKKII